jgi:hypothetical protein
MKRPSASVTPSALPLSGDSLGEIAQGYRHRGRSSQSVGAALTARRRLPSIGGCRAPSTHTRQRPRSLR